MLASGYFLALGETTMKLVWVKPEIVALDVGMEVTSYSPAEIEEGDVFV